VKEGRFGAYVTDGETNATLRRGDAVEAVTIERAAELLAEKRAKGPATKKSGARKTAAKTATKKTAKTTTAKKSAAKKTTAAKKSAAAKTAAP
jgi:DNA topoisomerase-1